MVAVIVKYLFLLRIVLRPAVRTVRFHRKRFLTLNGFTSDRCNAEFFVWDVTGEVASVGHRSRRPT